jgi:hypothetical protein
LIWKKSYAGESVDELELSAEQRDAIEKFHRLRELLDRVTAETSLATESAAAVLSNALSLSPSSKSVPRCSARASRQRLGGLAEGGSSIGEAWPCAFAEQQPRDPVLIDVQFKSTRRKRALGAPRAFA